LVCSGLCCGKNRKKGLNNPLQPQPTGCTGGAIPCLVGSNVQTAPYAPGSDNPGDCSQLKCDEADACCWLNNQPPADEINWVKATGQPDADKMTTNFGTSSTPSGSYFLTASDVAGTSEQTAQLYSCPITCSNGDITVKVKHWSSKGTKIQVCSETDPAGPPQNCQDLPTSNGNSDSVTIPKGENQRIVIQAKGFTEPTGTVAMVDEIDIQCDPCPDTTTTAAVTTAAPTAGNPCSYSPATGGGTAAENWGVQTAPYQNRLTGIPKPGEAQKFAACYTKKKGEKATLATNANFDKEYVVRFNYYKAVEGVNLKACCDDESTCPYGATPSVQTSDYRAWKTASILCKAGTKKVLFICENEKGASEGACGVDNIQLLQSSGGSPDDASQTACTGS